MFRMTYIMALTIVLMLAQTAAAQSVNWMTIDCGGGRSAAGVYAVTGTIGQFDATPDSLNSGAYSLKGGFWPSGTRYSCVGDYTRDGSVSLDDLFGFLHAYFAADPSADVNGIDGVTIQDVFDFLTGWFRGSCG